MTPPQVRLVESLACPRCDVRLRRGLPGDVAHWRWEVCDPNATRRDRGRRCEGRWLDIVVPRGATVLSLSLALGWQEVGALLRAVRPEIETLTGLAYVDAHLVAVDAPSPAHLQIPVSGRDTRLVAFDRLALILRALRVL
jgi:hypothetical protein